MIDGCVFLKDVLLYVFLFNLIELVCVLYGNDFVYVFYSVGDGEWSVMRKD